MQPTLSGDRGQGLKLLPQREAPYGAFTAPSALSDRADISVLKLKLVLQQHFWLNVLIGT